MSAEFSAQVSAQLRSRSGGVCEGCGRESASEKHHRQFKSRGGAGTVENGLDLCGLGNSDGCHGVAHSGLEGERRGWAIRSGFDPAEVPALVVLGVVHIWVLLTRQGTRVPISDARALAMMAAIGVEL